MRIMARDNLKKKKISPFTVSCKHYYYKKPVNMVKAVIDY